MKKILPILLFFLASFTVFSQNPEATAIGVYRSPIKLNDTVSFTFGFQNNSSRMITYDAENPVIISLGLRKLAPYKNADGTLGIFSGEDGYNNLLEYFKPRYSAKDSMLYFDQIKEIPGYGNDFTTIFVGEFRLVMRATYPSTREQMNGFNGNSINLNITYAGDVNINDNVQKFGIFTEGELPLSAKLGSFSAVNKGGMLNVLWSTLAENNNDRFVISASKDGKTFHAIDSLNTQAKNGLSEKEIKYTYSKKLNNVAAMLGVSATGAVAIGLLMLGIAFSLYKRSGKKTYISTLALVFAIGLVFAACRKDKNELDSQYAGTIWVQIVQVDKDGGSSSLGVTKVVNE